MKAVVRTQGDLFRFAHKAVDVLDGKPYTVTIKRFHRPRSNDQNAKLHAMLRELAEHCGYSEREMKDYFTAEFGPTMQVRIKAASLSGRTNRIPKGTSAYTVQEMAEMIEHVYRIGAEVGCVFTDGEG